MTAMRASAATHKNLKELSVMTGLSIQTVLEQAVEAYRRTVFLEQLNGDFAALQSDPVAWAEEQAERRQWEQTLGDGLPSENKE